MVELVLAKDTVNVRALDAALRGVIGADYQGMSTGPYGVRVHLARALTSEETSQIRALVAAHDPTELTPEQQAEADALVALEAARSANKTPLDEADYASTAAEIQTLARKVAWLEKEINFLQGH